MADTALDLDALQRAVDGLRTQQESVQRERAELQSMKATVEENLAQFKRRVKLNVGGSKFETTLTTLTRYPDSMLGSMFSGRHEVPPDEEGYVFIDRDGKHFGIILNFLRTGVLDVPTKEAAELKREMEYYQLPGLETATDAPDAPSLKPHAKTDGVVDQVHKKLLQMDFAFLGGLPLTKGSGSPMDVLRGIPNPGAFMVADLQPEQSVVIYVVATATTRGMCVTGSNPYMAGTSLSACCQHAFGTAGGWIKVKRTANMAAFSGIARDQNGVASKTYTDTNNWGAQIWFELHIASPSETPSKLRGV